MFSLHLAHTVLVATESQFILDGFQLCSWLILRNFWGPNRTKSRRKCGRQLHFFLHVSSRSAFWLQEENCFPWKLTGSGSNGHPQSAVDTPWGLRTHIHLACPGLAVASTWRRETPSVLPCTLMKRGSELQEVQIWLHLQKNHSH